MDYSYLIFAHLLGVVIFAAGHGVSMFVVFRVRREGERVGRERPNRPRGAGAGEVVGEARQRSGRVAARERREHSACRDRASAGEDASNVHEGPPARQPTAAPPRAGSVHAA